MSPQVQEKKRLSLDELMAERPSMDELMAEGAPAAAPRAGVGEHLQEAGYSAATGAAEAGASLPEALGYLMHLADYVRGTPRETHTIDGKTLAEHLDAVGGMIRGAVDKAPYLFGAAGLLGKRSEAVEAEPGGVAKSLATSIPRGAGNLAVTLATAGVGEAALGVKATTGLAALTGAQMTAGGYQDVKEWSGDEGKALLSGALNAAAGAVGGKILGGVLSKLPAAGRMAVARYAKQAAEGSATLAGLSLASDAIAKGLGDPRDRHVVQKALEQGALGFLTPAVSKAFHAPVETSQPPFPAGDAAHTIEAPAERASLELTAPETAPREITLTGEPLVPSFEEQVKARDAATTRDFLERAQGAGGLEDVDQMAADEAAGIGASRLSDRANPLTSAQLSEERIADAEESARDIAPQPPAAPMVPIEPDPHEVAAHLMEHGSLEEQIANPIIREHLQTLAGEAGSRREGGGQVIREGSGDLGERGGRIVTNESGLAKGTGFVHVPNSSWWKNRPGNMTGAEVKNLVARVTSDKPGKITPRQAEMLHFLVQQMPDVGSPVQPPAPNLMTEADIPADAPPMLRAQLMEQVESGQEIPKPGFQGMKLGEAPPAEPPSATVEVKSERQKAIEYLDSVGAEEWQKPEFWRSMPEPMQPVADRPEIAGEVAVGAEIPPAAAAEVNPSEPVTPVADLPDANDPAAVERFTNHWLGNRWLATYDANRDARVKEEGLNAIAGSREGGRALQKAILFQVDRLDSGEKGWTQFLGRIPEEARARFIESHALPPAAQVIADRIVAEDRALGDRAVEAGLIPERRDYFLRRIWKQEDGSSGATGSLFSLNPATTRGRTLVSIAEGLARGKELAVEGAVDAQRSARIQVEQAIADRNFIEMGLKAGILASEPLRGWEQVQHPAFVRRNIYAPPELAKRLNNALGTSRIAQTALGNAASAAQSLYRGSIFFGSAVHYANGLRAAIFQGADGGGPFKVLPNFNVAERYAEGRDAIAQESEALRRGVRNGLVLDIPPEWDELRARRQAAFHAVLEKTSKVPLVGRVAETIAELHERNEQFLFNKFFPNLQAQDYIARERMLQGRYKNKILLGELSFDDVARTAAKVTNDVFGKPNYQQLSSAKTRFQEIAHLRAHPEFRYIMNQSLVAPSWTESRIRLVAKSLQAGPEGAAYREVLGRSVARMALAHLAWDLAMASIHDDADKSGKSFRERLLDQWTEGGIGAQVTGVNATKLARAMGYEGTKPVFLGLSSVLSDPVGLVTDTGAFASRKIGILPKAFIELATGKDMLGRNITNFEELTGRDEKGFYKATGKGHVMFEDKGGQLTGETVSPQASGEGVRLPSWAILQAEESLPENARGLYHLARGNMDGWRLLLNSVGFGAHKVREKK